MQQCNGGCCRTWEEGTPSSYPSNSTPLPYQGRFAVLPATVRPARSILSRPAPTSRSSRQSGRRSRELPARLPRREATPPELGALVAKASSGSLVTRGRGLLPGLALSRAAGDARHVRAPPPLAVVFLPSAHMEQPWRGMGWPCAIIATVKNKIAALNQQQHNAS